MSAVMSSSSVESVDGGVFSSTRRREEYLLRELSNADHWSTYDNSKPDQDGQICLQKIIRNVQALQKFHPNVTADAIKLLKYKMSRDLKNRVILYQAEVSVRDTLLSVNINSKGHMTAVKNITSNVHRHPDRTGRRLVLRELETISMSFDETWTNYSPPDAEGREVLDFIKLVHGKDLLLDGDDQISVAELELVKYRQIKRNDKDDIISCEAIVKIGNGNYHVTISDKGKATIKRLHAANRITNSVEMGSLETFGFTSVTEENITRMF